MLTRWDGETLPDLLRRHGLDGIGEEPFPNDGWSGARLTALRRGDERFVLKRTSWAVDWIARATRDHALREGFVANGQLNLPAGIWAPYLGAAADGNSLAILMPDLTGSLIAWDGPGAAVPAWALHQVIEAMAELHDAPWTLRGGDSPDAEWPWCPVRERLELLGPPAAGRYRGAGIAVGERFVAGWEAFGRQTPAAARELVDRLATDSGPLSEALGRLPAARLHGDLKLANVGPMPDGRVALIDWGMASRSAVALELGWFLVSNSASLGLRPEVVLERYRIAAAARGSKVLGDWDAQVDLAWIVGLVLRGWRKGLDAEAGTVLASGVAAAADLAWWSEAAVAAADRRL